MKLIIPEKPSQAKYLADAFALSEEIESVDFKVRKKDKSTGKTKSAIHQETIKIYHLSARKHRPLGR